MRSIGRNLSEKGERRHRSGGVRVVWMKTANRMLQGRGRPVLPAVSQHQGAGSEPAAPLPRPSTPRDGRSSFAKSLLKI